MNYTITKLKEAIHLECLTCGGEVYVCSDCARKIKLEDYVHCNIDHHLCSSCFKEEKDLEAFG